MERRQEVVAPPPPSTTIPPIQNPAILPPCAANCGALFDANGACVPPFAPVADADTYEQCYCSQPGAAPFSTAISGVCDDSCASDGLSSIADWYRGLCNVENGGNNGGPTTTTTTTTGAQQTTTTTTTGGGSSDSDSDSSGSGGGSGGDWLSNHWQWVIMLVVLVVGIAGIWIGACLWRRRYLRKKDRQSTIGQKQSGSASHPSWGPGFAEPPSNIRNSMAPTPPSEDPQTNGSFMPGATASAFEEGEKRSKRKWIPKSRT